MPRKKTDSKRTTISLPKSLIDKVDALLAKEGYASRSELIRKLLMEWLEKNKE